MAEKSRKSQQWVVVSHENCSISLTNSTTFHLSSLTFTFVDWSPAAYRCEFWRSETSPFPYWTTFLGVDYTQSVWPYYATSDSFSVYHHHYIPWQSILCGGDLNRIWYQRPQDSYRRFATSHPFWHWFDPCIWYKSHALELRETSAESTIS